MGLDSDTESRRKKSTSKRSARKHWIFDSEGDQSSEDDFITRSHARSKGEKNEGKGTETEDESEEIAAVNELLEKYTVGFDDM